MASSCLLDPRWQRPVFLAASREYTWLDVLLAAMVRGEWRPFERRLTSGLACLLEADASGLWPDEGRLDLASTAFRHDRDLLSRADTLGWLDPLNLSLEAWTDFLIRDLLLAQWADRIDALVERHGSAVQVTAEAMAAEGHCTGTFDRMARVLAGRVALIEDAAPELSHTTARDVEHVRRDHIRWLDAFEPYDLTTRLAELIVLERRYEKVALSDVTEAALSARIAEHAREWLTVDLERLSFERIDAAREAVCCLRIDGLSPGEVALRARVALRDLRLLVDEVEPELRDAVIAGAVGEPIGPLSVGSHFDVCVIAAKGLPELADPVVRARAERLVIGERASSAVLAHIRWVRQP